MKKLRASSLLEVIIAMVLIVAIFVIAMLIFTNVTRMSLSAQKLRAEAVVNHTMLLTEQAKDPADQSLEVDDLDIELKVAADSLPGLDRVTITAYDQNKVPLAKLQKLIIIQP